MTAMEKYTKYRCVPPGCAKASTWSGAMGTGERSTDCPGCGVEMIKVVEDGHRYRLEWEGFGPFIDEWHPVSREDDDQYSIVVQWRQLAEWERTGEEPIRNVRLLRSVTTFEPWTPT